MRSWCLLAAIGLLLFAERRAAMAEVYSDPSGFSLTVPDGWHAISSTSGFQFEDWSEDVKSWMRKNNFDLSKVSVMILREGKGDGEGFLENANGVVFDKVFPISEEAVKEAISGARQALSAKEVTIESLTGQVQRGTDRDMIVLDYVTRIPLVTFSLHQRQIFFPFGKSTLILTYTTRNDTFAKYEPVFTSMVASLSAPQPVVTGFDFSRVIVMVVVGGLIGGLIGLFKRFGK
jgi:hypothetical protein